jgi:hypothetical protein
MGFTDATPVNYALDAGIKCFITLDKKRFNIYRTGRKPFNIIP